MTGKTFHRLGAAVVLMLAMSALAPAQLQIAEDLLVDLRADDLEYGEAASWPNRGSLGDFTAVGAPVVETVGGLTAVTFDGASYFEGPASTPGIEGAATRTLEVWAYNPSMPGEETLLSWSHRGGPEGSNMAFNYGNDGRWGSMGHWGGDTHDMGWWGSHSPAPEANHWWHLVYTYDGTAARVYVNGVEESVRDPIDLNTHGGNVIRVAAQADDTGASANTGLNFSGSIAEVRIHDGVLTPQQIRQNFQLGGPRKAHDPDPADGATAVVLPLLQWAAGLTAQWHDVYLGTSPDLGAADLVGRNPGPVVMYWHLPGLTPGTTYYWRVDEVEADGVTIHAGDVWSFTSVTLTAHTPAPADGAKFQSTDADLLWQMGKNAASHDVYFGTSRQDVADGVGDTFQGNQPGTMFDPGPLATGTTYYWRVDEIETGGTKQVGDVWSFTTVPDIAVSDPNLVGWWKLDEGEGTTAVDWSGQGNHGTLHGGTEWIDGYDGGGLNLDGADGYVALPIGSVIASLEAATITTWVNFSNAGGAWQRIFDFGNNTMTYMFLTPRLGTAGEMRFAITIGGGGAPEQMATASSALVSGWHHVAATISASGLVLYLDGQVVASGATSVVPSALGATTNNWLGRSQYVADAYFRGALDDFRIYDFAMSAAEIPETMRGDPKLAWAPHPADGSIVDIRQATSLGWSPGETAVQHDIYLATDRQVVEEADTTASAYLGRQAGTTYSPPAGVVEFGGGTYYWRLDEVEADGTTVHTGRLWSFTVPDYLIVDDFESYTDEVGERIFQTWLDGWGYTEPEPVLGNDTGATVGYLQAPFAEQMIVHSGSQSMPFDYNNVITPFYSETERTWPTPQDWTDYEVDTLVLWFRGNPPRFVEDGPTNITMSASGNDIWDVADQFRYAYRRLNGNGSIVARVDSVVNTDGWAKAGVMIRERLEAGAKHAAVVVTPNNGVSFPRRPFTNDVSEQINQTPLAAPHWVRLTRTGDTFQAEHSTDGAGWTSVGTDPLLSSDDITMMGTIYIGLCLTSHNVNAVTTAEFSNVQTTGGVSGQWQVADIGVDHPGNDADRLYVVVQDSTGRLGVSVHPDPGAVLATEWTEWRIPLSEFTVAGVNVQAVTKMYIGVGDRDHPTPDGAGMLYVDDIRVMKSDATTP